ncbi:J domain-containing protein [Psidium guajava]|nr:J domain-containing protein [Psidium guajava]
MIFLFDLYQNHGNLGSRTLIESICEVPASVLTMPGKDFASEYSSSDPQTLSTSFYH